MGFSDVEAVDVVQVSVPGFGDHGQAAVEHARDASPAPLNYCVPDNSDAVRVRDHYGVQQERVVIEPRSPGHFAIPIQAEPAGKDLGQVASASRKNGGYTGANRAH